MDDQLSDHFHLSEFDCHDGSLTPLAAQDALRHLVTTVLEPMRLAWGGPLVVVSGYRSPNYNRGIGGALQSYHLRGMAVDIAPVMPSRSEALYALVESLIRRGLPVGGLGHYPRWVHVDTRKLRADGVVAHWTGSKQGSEIA